MNGIEWTHSYLILAITLVVVAYRFVTLIWRRRFWELPIFLAGSILAVIGAFSLALYQQNIHIINELGERFDLVKSITEVPQIKDGDSFKINGVEFRLKDIDAPELRQCCKRPDGSKEHCGEVSRTELLAKIAGGEVTCSWLTTELHGRPLATCLLGEVNLNSWMVRNGHAIAYRYRRGTDKPYRPKKKYLEEEHQAKAAKKGYHAYDKPLLPNKFRMLSKKKQKRIYQECLH